MPRSKKTSGSQWRIRSSP